MRGTRSARPRGLGGDFEFLPLKSPRNPITPFETSRVSTLHPELYKILRAPIQNTAMRRLVANASHSCNSSPHQNPPSFRKSALVLHMLHMLHMSGVCRKKKDIRRKSNGFELLPPLRRSPSLEEGGLWRGELQRLVASLQRSDVFATVGCTAVPRRGAHRAPVYPRCYNNPSSGRAKDHRGDRKAPICNRQQGRKALTGEAPRPPSSREGDRRSGGRSKRAPLGLGD